MKRLAFLFAVAIALARIGAAQVTSMPGATGSGSVISVGAPAIQVIGGNSCCTYYVDNVLGADTNNGTSAATPFANAPGMTNCASKCAAVTLAAGQSVGLLAGDTWRQTLTPAQSGSPGSPITYTAYGSGAQPVISGGNLLTWTQGTGQTQEACSGACLFDSGYETAAFADWTAYDHAGTATMTIDSGSSAHGASGVLITGGSGSNAVDSYKSITALATGNTYYFRFYIREDQNLASQQVRAFWLQNGSGTQVAYVGFSQNTTQAFISMVGQATNTGGTMCSFANATGWLLNGWNYVDITYTVSATLGASAVSVNGNSVTGCTQSALNTSGAAGANRLYIGNQFTSNLINGGTLHIDDVRYASAGLIGPYSGALPTTVWSASQASDPLFPNNGVPLVKVTGNLDALSCCNTGAPTPTTNGYFWDGSANLYVYSATNPANTDEIPTRSQEVFLNGKSYIAISGIDLRGSAQQGLYGQGHLSGLTLSRNTMELNYKSGVEIDEGTAVISNVLISANTMQRNGASGMQSEVTTGMGGWQLLNNSFSNNSYILANGYWANSGGIDLFCNGGNGPALISGNTATGNGVGQLANGYVQGVGLWLDTCNAVTITGNTASANISSGIMVEKNQNSKVIYNTSYNNDSCTNGSNTCGGNILLRTGEGTGASGNLIANNTTYGGSNAGIACYADTGGGLNSTNTIENNLAISGSTYNLDVAQGCNNDGTHGTGNIYSTNGFGAPVSTLAFWQGTGAISTYAGLDTAYGSAMSNMQLDPLFVNPGAGNFALQSGSPAIGAGVFIPGVSTSPTPNIGAK